MSFYGVEVANNAVLFDDNQHAYIEGFLIPVAPATSACEDLTLPAVKLVPQRATSLFASLCVHCYIVIVTGTKTDAMSPAVCLFLAARNYC